MGNGVGVVVGKGDGFDVAVGWVAGSGAGAALQETRTSPTIFTASNLMNSRLVSIDPSVTRQNVWRI